MPYQKKSKDVMEMALKALEEGGSLRRVAADFGIKKSTLLDWRNSRRSGKERGGAHPNRALSDSEEVALVGYIVWMADHGFPITRAVAVMLAIHICRASGRENKCVNLEKGLSKMWWTRFRDRHRSTVALRRPSFLEPQRVHGATVERVNEHFHICQALYEKHGFSGTPHLIYNCDETGFGDKGSSRQRVLCHRSRRTVFAQQVTTRDHVTVHCCANAAGETIPPFIIFEKCLPSTAYSLEGPTNALYAWSDSGYMDSELFLKWLEHFVRFARQERPLLLFLDQHEAHIAPRVVDFCLANRIELMCFPAHTTHVLQPLDVSVFGPLKAAFNNMARNLGLVRGNLQIGKSKFSPVLKVAVEQALTVKNIKSGFRRTGLFPLDRTAVDESKLIKGLHHPTGMMSLDSPTSGPSTGITPTSPLAVPDTVPRVRPTVGTTSDNAESPRGPATTTAITALTPPPASSSHGTSSGPSPSPSPSPSPGPTTASLTPSPGPTTAATSASLTPSPGPTTAASLTPSPGPTTATVTSPSPPFIAAASPTTITITASAPVAALPTTTTAPSTTTAPAAAWTPTEQCPTCRRYPNPLVTAGIIPASLADILLPPQFDRPSRGRGRRMPLPARVITSEEYVAHLAARRAEAAQKEQARQDRANQRLMRQQEQAARRAAAEEQRQTREAIRAAREAQQQERQRQRTVHICTVCNEGGLGLLLECDSCTLWYHAECLNTGRYCPACIEAAHAEAASMFEL